MHSIPYENTLIGYFLYLLGYRASEEGYAISKMSPNLLQQTPLDKTLGDLMLNTDSRYILIEFKRSHKEIKDEITKKIDLIYCLIDNDFSYLAEQCHYLAIGHNKWEEFNLIFSLYFDAILGNDIAFDRYITSQNFIDMLLNNDIGLPKKEFQFYMKQLDICRPDKPSGGCKNCALIEIREDGGMTLHDFREFSVGKEINVYGEIE